MIVLGIDPGKKGAVVMLDGLEVVYSRRADGPDGYRTQATNTDPDPGDLLALWADLPARPGLVLIEAPSWHAGPGQRMPASVAGRHGMEHALWRMLLAAHGVPYQVMAAKDWRKRDGIVVGKGGDPKAATVAVVRARLPGLDLVPARGSKAHDGLADAAGLALAGGVK